MALERQSIEKKDFPIGRRGYEPEAVDAHLRDLADQVEHLRRSAQPRTETLASTASEQVRTIIEAAETSAADIRQQAEDEARAMRFEANAEARDTRDSATAEAGEYIAKVSEATAAMAKRLESMDSELSGLFEQLRSGSNRLGADLKLLSSDLSQMRESLLPRRGLEPEAAVTSAAFEPEFEAAPATEAPAAFEAQTAGQALGQRTPGSGAVPDLDTEAAEPANVPEPTAYHEPGPTVSPDNGAEDIEGARLIALNMALNGTPREETDRYLAENFELSDRSALLDEVYASLEG